MKKILLLSVLLSQLVIAFGQTVGQIVKSKTIFSSLGVTVSYTVTYYGIIDCNNNTATGHKKYRLNFNAQNNSSSTVRLVASRIDLDDNLDRFKSNCYSSEAILLGSYPGFEQFGTLIPGENANATKYVYMDQRSADLPYVTYNFIASTVPNKNQTPANTQPQLNTNNPRSNNNQPKQNSSLNTTNSNSTNTSNGEQSITDINQEIRDLQRRQNVACSKLQQQGQPYNSRLCDEGFNGGLAQTDTDSRRWVVQLRSQVRELESATSSSSGNTNTQQNDLTEYNRSKAEMERKLQEENERRQQQATQLNNQKQQFINVYNEGVEFGNTGKYAEAAAKYQQAIGLATNDADRQTAQNAYNKVTKSQNKTEALNKLSNLLTEVESRYQSAKAKQQKEEDKYQAKLKELKREADKIDEEIIKRANEKKNKESEFMEFINYYKDAVSINNSEFGKYSDYIVINLEKEENGGFKYIKSQGAYSTNSITYYASDTSNFYYKNANFTFANNTDTLSVILTFNLFYGSSYSFERNILLSSTLISGDRLSQILHKLFDDQIYNERNIPFGGKGLVSSTILTPPQNINVQLSKLSIASNSLYKGWQSVFKENITLKKGNDRTSYNYNGGIYFSGIGNYEEDIENAIMWYKKAAELGDSSSMYLISLCYQRLNDNQNNFLWLRKSAEASYWRACYEMGRIGESKEKNYSQALNWYLKAIMFETTHNNEDLALLHFAIGWLYRSGDNYLKKDLIKSKEYFKKSCELEESRCSKIP